MKKISSFSKYLPHRIKKALWRLRDKTIGNIGKRRVFWQDYNDFKKHNSSRFLLSKKDIQPCLDDKTVETGFDQHYIYHPAWAARILAKNNPKLHVDIASSLTFSSIVSAFIPVDFYDYRPANIKLSGLSAKAADLLSLPFGDNSIESLSCMHTIEHVGLGRYGDPVNPDSDLKAMSELARVLMPGGSLLIAVPVGRPQLRFNAHRIYSYEMVMEGFSGLHLEEFSLIPDNSARVGMIIKADPKDVAGQEYACGCFWFKKQ